MTFIPQNETITPGDVIVTSGLEPLIPRGLTIGTIEAVEKEAYQPFQKAVLTPLASLNKLRVVSVLLTSSTSTEI
jgi:rod shape-determining protein MreC